MSMLLIGICVWMLLVVFVCSLGRAAKAGDRVELERVRLSAGVPASDDEGIVRRESRRSAGAAR